MEKFYYIGFPALWYRIKLPIDHELILHDLKDIFL